MAVVFTDNFTVAANANIDAHPSGSPDYAYNEGSGSDLQVNATNDRVQVNFSGEAIARIVDAAVPTGDQEITADVWVNGSGSESAFVAARCAAGGALTCYMGYVDLNATNEVILYRYNAGSLTELASADRGFAPTSALRSMRLRATGTNPVALELQIDATAVLTYNDSSGSRLTSGPPGIGGYNNTANTVYIDNVSVDDLITGGSGDPIVQMLANAEARRRRMFVIDSWRSFAISKLKKEIEPIWAGITSFPSLRLPSRRRLTLPKSSCRLARV